MHSQNESNRVVVVDLQMPCLSMVLLMVKWALASIPVIIILATLFSLVAGLMFGMLWPRTG